MSNRATDRFTVTYTYDTDAFIARARRRGLHVMQEFNEQRDVLRTALYHIMLDNLPDELDPEVVIS